MAKDSEVMAFVINSRYMIALAFLRVIMRVSPQVTKHDKRSA